MRVLVYGEAAITGSGAWCYAETIREMGHEVMTFSDSAGLEKYRTSLVYRALRKVLGGPLPLHRREHGRQLLQEARAIVADIVIVLKGLYLGPEEVRALKELGSSVVNINHDDFFSLNRSNRSRHLERAVPLYDHIFTTREVNVAEIRPRNPCVEFFPFAYYPRIHRLVTIPAAERSLWDVDAVFIGTYEKERCRLMEWLVQRVPGRYAVWGGSWNRMPLGSPLRPYVKRRELYGEQMAKAIGGAKVALAFLRKKNRDDYTQRTFEIPACGGVLLGERTARHQALYREGVEAEFFDPRNPEELAVKVRQLVGDTLRRERIRAAGTAALLRQRHTYRDRLERLFQVCGERGPPRARIRADPMGRSRG